MALITDQDRLIAFKTLGQEVLLYPGTNDQTNIYAIFNNAFEDIESGIADVATRVPVITCRWSDVSNVSQGDAVKVSSTSYTVRRIEDDSQGVAIVYLHKA